MQITQRYILQIYEVQRVRSATAFGHVWPVYGRIKNEKEKKFGGGEKDGGPKIKEGNGVRYENIRWDVKTVNSRAFVLSPRSPPLSRTRKSTGLMVSFIISYTSAILSVRVRPKSQPLPTLSPHVSSAFGLSSGLSLSLFYPLPDVYPKNALRNSHVEVFYVSWIVSPWGVFTFFFRMINHKLMCVRPRNGMVV